MSNDGRILELQEQIEAKRKELGDEPELDFVTDGSLRVASGDWVDLRTISEDVAIGLLVDLNSRRLSANDLGVLYQIGEHSVEDWMADIKAGLEYTRYQREKRRLELLEAKLDILLSEEKKKERKIEAIADEI